MTCLTKTDPPIRWYFSTWSDDRRMVWPPSASKDSCCRARSLFPIVDVLMRERSTAGFVQAKRFNWSSQSRYHWFFSTKLNDPVGHYHLIWLVAVSQISANGPTQFTCWYYENYTVDKRSVCRTTILLPALGMPKMSSRRFYAAQRANMFSRSFSRWFLLSIDVHVMPGGPTLWRPTFRCATMPRDINLMKKK